MVQDVLHNVQHFKKFEEKFQISRYAFFKDSLAGTTTLVFRHPQRTSDLQTCFTAMLQSN